MFRGYRHLETGWGLGIPKNIEMHRYILLEWAPINILRRVPGSISHGHYTRAIEVGIGNNTVTAEALAAKGVLLCCTDVRKISTFPRVFISVSTISSHPEFPLYKGADVIYAIRPAIEMIPPMIDLARSVNCDLIVYHLGFESYGSGGEIIDCGVLLHRYHAKSEHVKA